MNLSGARRSCGAGLIAAAVAALVFFSGLAPADAGTIIMFTDENAYHAGETIPAEFPHDSSGIVQERTSDVGRGQHLRIRDGDWTEYNFSNPRTATFVVQARVASGSNGGTISFNRNGSALGSIEVASTGGWDNWTTVSTTIEFEYGLAPLRLTYTGEGDDELFHLNWISITWLDATPDFFEGTEVFAIPGQIEAEDWIDISRSFNAPTDDTGGGEHVTGILGGDWTEYHVDVEQAGRYEVEARVATIPALTGFYRGGFINIITDDRRLGLLEVGDTGGDGSWATVSTTVELEAGRQVLQLAFTGDLTGGNMMRINWVRFERKPGPPKPPLDDEDRRQLAMAELIGALESYGDANGTYLVDGGGFKGRGSGWLFYGLEGTTYPVSVASILTAEGHLSADAVRDPLWVSETSTVGDVLVYRCKDRVAVFTRHSGIRPSSEDADWWRDNGCTRYPIENLNASYYQISKHLGD